MNLALVVEERMQPIPGVIRVVQNYGHEQIIVDDQVVASGEAMFLDGSPDDFADWLRPFDGVWISENPSGGRWEVVHVK